MPRASSHEAGADISSQFTEGIVVHACIHTLVRRLGFPPVLSLFHAWVTAQWPEKAPGSLPAVAQKEPGGQGIGSGLPSGQKDPAGHIPPVAVAGHRQLVVV